MCAVSAIGDWWMNTTPSVVNNTIMGGWTLNVPAMGGWTLNVPAITRAEFDALKKEVEALKEMLIAAKKYDEVTGQPDCEMEDKVKLIKQVAELVGVSLEEIFGKEEKNG